MIRNPEGDQNRGKQKWAYGSSRFMKWDRAGTEGRLFIQGLNDVLILFTLHLKPHPGRVQGQFISLREAQATIVCVPLKES